MNIIKTIILVSLSIFGLQSAWADEDEFLSPDEAFRISVEAAGPGLVKAHWEIAEGYYLYQKRFKVKAGDDNTQVEMPALPPAEEKYDENFGDVLVYHDSVELMIPTRSSQPEATVSIRWQGCAEAGLCYPPVTKKFTVTLPEGTAAPIASAAQSAPATSAPQAAASESEEPETEMDFITKHLRGNSFAMFFVFMLFGIGLALTPCVLPMVPILSSIITGQDNLSTRKAFSMSLVYVLTMALTFALAGALVGAAGSQALQNPKVLTAFALILFALSLSMFGLYKLQLPSFITTKLTEFSNKQEGGNLIGVGIMGMLSALVVGPCVTAPLAAALVFIADTGSYVKGFFALLGLGLGMGIPLVAIGTAAGSLVPRAGNWMIRVQHVFGFVILGLAIWMLDRFMDDTPIIFMWGALLIAFGVYCNPFDHNSDKEPGWHTCFKALGLVSVLWGGLLVISAASGGTNLLQPLQHLKGGPVIAGQTIESTKPKFTKIKNLEELQAVLADAKAEGKPAMFDFYADWCTSCMEYEKITFPNPEVKAKLDQMVLIKADVTEGNEDDKALFEHFKIIGPPTIVFFDQNGNELPKAKLIGFKKPADFVKHLDTYVFK